MSKTSWSLTTGVKFTKNNKIEWAYVYRAILNSQFGVGMLVTLNLKIMWNLIKSSEFRTIGWDRIGANQRYITPIKKTPYNLKFNSKKLSTKTGIKFSGSRFLWEAFIGFWGSSRPKGNQEYCTNRDFMLLFSSHSSNNQTTSLVSVRKYFSRWVDANNLLFNLFYAGASVQMLSNSLFMEETLVFNWHYSSKNYKLFKYVQPYFMFKDFTHGGSVYSSILMIFMQNIDFCIIIDVNNHKKLRGYFQMYNLFTVALVPTNYSPWDVSYPIPSFSDSKLSQFYFLKWLFLLRSRAERRKYSNVLSSWTLPVGR